VEHSRRARIHVISETAFYGKGQGVHTAFVDCVNFLGKSGRYDVVVNGAGWGDLFHAHTYGPYYFWKGRRYKGRRVFTAHVIPDSAKGSIPAERLMRPLVRWYLRRVYTYADVCISISPVVTDQVRRLSPSTQVVEIVNPLNTERFRPSQELRRAGRRRLGLPDNAFVALGVGQLEKRKGVEDFIDIAAACPEVRFVWVGGRPYGAATEGVGRINAKMRREDCAVQFAGLFDLEDMPTLYNAADLFLFPSLQENCPMAPIEAAACGLPVVFRDLPEYRRLYQSPYLAAPDTPAFVEFVRRLHNDEAFRERAKGLSEALIRQFETTQVLEALDSVYETLLRSRQPVSRLSRFLPRRVVRRNGAPHRCDACVAKDEHDAPAVRTGIRRAGCREDPGRAATTTVCGRSARNQGGSGGWRCAEAAPRHRTFRGSPAGRQCSRDDRSESRLT